MSALSNYAENKVLDHICGTATFTRPASVHLALFTADPTDAGSGAEVAGNGYARQPATFEAAANGATQNAAEITFTATGVGWGAVSHWGLFDAAAAGNLLIHGALSAAKTVEGGDSLTIAAGALDISAA